MREGTVLAILIGVSGGALEPRNKIPPTVSGFTFRELGSSSCRESDADSVKTRSITSASLNLPVRRQLSGPDLVARASPRGHGDLVSRLYGRLSVRGNPDKMVLDGLRRIKEADYRGAVDSFRTAVIESEGSVRATAHFALGLILMGDGRNADKALRAAVELGALEKIEVASLFKDEKEATRVKKCLGAMNADGLLAAAWVESQAGLPERLVRLSEKDPVARRLLKP